MISKTEYLTFNTKTTRAFVNITPEVRNIVEKSEIKEGLCLVNAMHITASVFINDNESGLHKDFDNNIEEVYLFWTSNLPRDKREQYVLQLYHEGKTIREISELVHMSFRDIGAIINRYKDKIERENGQLEVKEKDGLETHVTTVNKILFFRHGKGGDPHGQHPTFRSGAVTSTLKMWLVPLGFGSVETPEVPFTPGEV